MKAYWFCVAALIVIGGAAHATDKKDIDDCKALDPARGVAACTRVLLSPDETADSKRLARLNRGLAYSQKRNHDKAIADFAELIRLNPKDAAAFAGRCAAYAAKGEDSRALADCNKSIGLSQTSAAGYLQRGSVYWGLDDDKRALADAGKAVQLDAKQAAGFRLRGLLRLYTGSVPGGLSDLNKATELDPRDAYSALWLDIAGQRSGLPSRLPAATAALDMKVWPGPVVRLLQGQLTPAAVLAGLDDPDLAVKVRRLCEANFYTGIMALRREAKDEAATLFAQAVAGCPHDLVEWGAAKHELAALGAAH